MSANTLKRFRKLGTAVLRLTVAAGFLWSVGDRFGAWGPPGAAGVNWGDFEHFPTYTGEVNSFLPSRFAPVLAWGSTVAEILLGLTLLLGLFTRLSALLSGVLLLIYASALTVSFGIGTAISMSVPIASAGAFLLATMPGDTYIWSLDQGRRSRDGKQDNEGR